MIKTVESSRFDGAFHRWLTLAFWGLILISIVPRLFWLDAPLVEGNSYRQTQTALSVHWMLQEGVTFPTAPLPIFGPPWVMPYEFPLVQYSATLIGEALGASSTTASRLNSLIYFYLSAWALALFIKSWSKNRGFLRLTLLFYLFSPFAILWSRAATIDYPAVFFSLIYFWAFMQCLSARTQFRLWAYCVIALLAGSAGYLIKPMFMLMVDIPIGLCTVYMLYRHLRCNVIKARRAKTAFRQKMRPSLLLIIQKSIKTIAMVFIPLFITFLWTQHADVIKSQSVEMSFLSSDQLLLWTFGTWDQRMDPQAWGYLLQRVILYALPLLWTLLGMFGLIMLLRTTGQKRMIIAGCALATLATPLVFFPLYSHELHDYYFVNFMPWLSLFVGYGLYALYKRINQFRGLQLRLVCFTVLISCLLFSLWPGMNYLKRVYWYRSVDQVALAQLGNIVKKHAEPGDAIVISQGDFNSAVPYFSERKAYMIIRPVDKDMLEVIRQPGFQILVVLREYPEVLEHFPNAEKLESFNNRWDIYAINQDKDQH